MTAADELVTYRLDMPWKRPPLRSNDSRGQYCGNPYAYAKRVKAVRLAVWALAKQAKIPTGSHLTVQFFYAPGHNGKMDSHNLHPTVKAAVDALAKPTRRSVHAVPWVGIQLVPDDTDEYVTILPPTIVRPPEPGPRCWLTVQVAP